MRLTTRLNIVWRTVSFTRASTAASPCVRNLAYDSFSRLKATMTRIICTASWTMWSDSISIPLTLRTWGPMREP
jgi:hypothetical protein